MSKLTPQIILEIQERSAAGISLRDTQTWLLESKGITYSHVSISRLLKRRRSTRTEMAEQTIKPLIEKLLTNDLNIMEGIIADCQATIDIAKKKGDQRLKLQAIGQMKQLLELSFKIKGINTEEEKPVESVDYNEIIHRFDWKKKDENE
jgi:hypothetical protein